MINTNREHLDYYRFLCMNKGMTKKSIAAICGNDLRLYMEWLEDKDVITANHEDVQRFLMHCAIERKNKGEALNRKHTNISMFYKRLIINKDLEIKNPVDKVDRPKVRKKVKAYLKNEEYMMMISYLEGIEDLQGLALISMMWSSACRVSEIEQLDIDMLDHIERTFIVTGKGQKQRECLFSKDASERVKKFLKNREDSNPYLFLNFDKTKRLKDKAIQTYVKDLGKSAGVQQNVHPHLFRHGRAMYLLMKGADLETIQRVLGHESIATTQIYAHMNFKAVKSKVDALDED